MMQKHVDDFNVTVEDVGEGCVDGDGGWEKGGPGVYDRCVQSLWGVWTGCAANLGRGGEVTAGCKRYRLAVLE